MFLFLSSRHSLVPHGERRLLVACALSYPFLVVRYVYALLVDFAGDRRFNSYFGDESWYLCMAVLVEFVVVVICETVGFTLRQLPKDNTEEVEMGGSGRGNGHVQVNSQDSADVVGAGGRRKGQTGKPKRKFKGPVSWVFFQVKDGIEARREGKEMR